MYTIIGIERKLGQYEGYNYDNTLLHVTEPIVKNGSGVRVSTIKIKTALLDEVMELGFVVEPLFDKYKNCIRLIRKE